MSGFRVPKSEIIWDLIEKDVQETRSIEKNTAKRKFYNLFTIRHIKHLKSLIVESSFSIIICNSITIQRYKVLVTK